MLRSRILPCILVLWLAGATAAADNPLLTAVGTVDKVGKDSLTVRPRNAEGRFEKALVLRVTGTSKVTTLTPQTRAGKVVLTQRDTELKDVQPKQTVALIYTTGASSDLILLSAVVQLTDGK